MFGCNGRNGIECFGFDGIFIDEYKVVVEDEIEYVVGF